MGKSHPEVSAVLAFIRDELHPRLLDTRDEIAACLNALEGRFVPPGPSGAPSRGQARILPTGRNFYSVDLIDKAVQMVASLKESHDGNFVRRHVLADMRDLANKGLDERTAFRQATFRVFGSAPGSYGAGVAQLVESKAWKEKDELGAMFVRWSSCAYGPNAFGEPSEDLFKRNLPRVAVTVKNEDSRENDMMSCTDFYNYHGGLIAAVRSVQDGPLLSLAGDSADPDNVVVRSVSEEARHVLRSRLLNPKWLEGLKRHGYEGAGDISKAMDIVFGWDATADAIDDWMYERFARKVALDKDMREWLKKTNPFALHNIPDKLLEAVSNSTETT